MNENVLVSVIMPSFNSAAFQEIVSIVMPAYNSSATIGAAIGSVIRQSYPHWRLYVVDDSSVDDTASIVAAFADERIVYFRQPQNGGVAKARNLGIELAQGTYIAFLDSDDLWEPEKLASQIPLLEQGYDVVCAHYAVFSESPEKVTGIRRYPFHLAYARLLRGNCIGNLTGIYNQQRLGKCQQQVCGHEDYVMWLELVRRARQAACVQKVLARYRVASQSLSGNKVKAARWQWRVYRQQLQLGRVRSAYYWTHYVLAAVYRAVWPSAK